LGRFFDYIKNMKNKTLFIGATHGNEPIGVNVLKKIEKKLKIDWTIGNPKALELGQRKYQADLNRSAPGDKNSDIYESRRAAEIICWAKDYKYVIDLHGSKRDFGAFVIITRLTQETLFLASMIDVGRIVYIPSFCKELEGPISEYMDCAIEIECGDSGSNKSELELERILSNFLKKKDTWTEIDMKAKLSKMEIFEIYDFKRKLPGIEIDDFKPTMIDNEKFYPIFVSSYKDNYSIAYFKMKKIQDIFKHKQLR